MHPALKTLAMPAMMLAFSCQAADAMMRFSPNFRPSLGAATRPTMMQPRMSIPRAAFRPPAIRPRIGSHVPRSVAVGAAVRPRLAPSKVGPLIKKRRVLVGSRKRTAPQLQPTAFSKASKPAIRKPAAVAPLPVGPLPRPRPTPNGMADRVRDLTLWAELARLGDLKESLDGKRALDQNGSDGGSARQHGPASDFQRPDFSRSSNKSDPPELWKPGPSSPAAYNPGLDQDDGFTPPTRGRSDPGSKPGVTTRPGRAGAGLPGPGGETSQDGGENGGSQVEREDHTYDDGTSSTTVREENQDGSEYRRMESRDADGEPMGTITVYITKHGARAVIEDFPNGARSRTYYNPQGKVIKQVWESPSSQPDPEKSGSADSFPCLTTSTGCGPAKPKPTTKDKVAQPGTQSEDGAQPFSAGVAERKNVVTNPVDPENHVRTGGGRRPRPIQHVTQPGSAGPDTPPGR